MPSYQQPPATLAAPTIDIDDQARPAGRLRHRRRRDPAATGRPVDHEDRRRDLRPARRVAHLHDRRSPTPGPSAVSGAPVTDTFPAALTVDSWTCTAVAGSSCTATGSGNARTGTVDAAERRQRDVHGHRDRRGATRRRAASPTRRQSRRSPRCRRPRHGQQHARPTPTGSSAPLPALGVARHLQPREREHARRATGARRRSSARPRSGSTQPGLRRAPRRGDLERRRSPPFGASQGAAFTFANAPGHRLGAAERPGPQGERRQREHARQLHPRRLHGRHRRGRHDDQLAVARYTTRATFAATFASGDTLERRRASRRRPSTSTRRAAPRPPWSAA